MPLDVVSRGPAKKVTSRTARQIDSGQSSAPSVGFDRMSSGAGHEVDAPASRRTREQIAVTSDTFTRRSQRFGSSNPKQNNVAVSVAGIIEPTLQAAETAYSANRPTNDLTANDLYLRAYALFFSSSALMPEVLHLLDRAIERDPRYGPALAFAANCCVRLVIDGRSENLEASGRKCVGLARRALEVASNDPGVLANAAVGLAYFGEDIGAMMALVDRALALNPSFARGWFISGHRPFASAELASALARCLTVSKIPLGTLPP